MAIIWADFPSGQRGLYGTDKTLMLNGIWAEVDGGVLVEDPDPSIGAAGVVFRTDCATSSSGNNSEQGRFALPAEVTTLGLAFRTWLAKLPTNASYYPYFSFRDNANNGILTIRVTTTGQLAVYSGGDIHGGSGTLLDTSVPALTANAYHHIEVSATKGAGSGAIEIRVNGGTKLDLSGLTLSANNIAQIIIGSHEAGGGDDPAMISYWKDLVIWDTSGSEANDFQGSVAVYDLYTDADVSLNWAPSVGALGWPLIADENPSGTLTVSGAISDGNVVQIDNTYYRFSSGSLDSGAPAGTSGNPWRVLIGATEADSMQNLFDAIGATGVAGTQYSTALTAHTTVDANGVTATQVSVEAKIQTASAIVTTETGANLAWTGGTLTYGPTDPSYIEADDTPPDPAVFTMTDLPPDVTSVRALIPIMRAMKTDGGDCNVQAGLSPDNVAWANGADEPMTTAFTYYWSPIHTNPDTGFPWTPGEVNDAYVRVNRTL